MTKKNTNKEEKPTLSEVRRAAAMKSAEVRTRISKEKQEQNPKTSIGCYRADAERLKAIADTLGGLTMPDAVARCVDAYEVTYGKPKG